jgi:acyl-CoA synthetase (AMP-forming)/AMP-acid ligase II
VVDLENGKTLGPNRAGELCFHGDLVMKGYKGNPAATDACLDAAGWVCSGDIGYFDDDGYVYIVDRLKELIKYKGFQVSVCFFIVFFIFFKSHLKFQIHSNIRFSSLLKNKKHTK